MDDITSWNTKYKAMLSTQYRSNLYDQNKRSKVEKDIEIQLQADLFLN